MPGVIFELRHNGENIYPETQRILVGDLLRSQRHNGGSTVHFTLQIFSVLAFGTVTSLGYPGALMAASRIPLKEGFPWLNFVCTPCCLP